MTPGGHDDYGSVPLRELAAHVGIVSEYHDMGGHVHVTSDETRRTLLAAFGIDASTDAGARAALSKMRADARSSLFPKVRVARVGSATTRSLLVRSPSTATSGRWRLTLTGDTGVAFAGEGVWAGDENG